MVELVAVRATSARQFVDAWDRVAQLGDAILPLDPSAPDEHNADLLRRLRPAALLTPYPGRPDQLRTVRLPDPAPVPRATAAVVTTSGTTGAPKGVVLSRDALEASVAASLERLACVDGEAWLLCLPWHHVAGLSVIRRSRRLGVEPVLHDRFDVDEVAMAIATDAVRWVSLVPTQLGRLLDAGAPLARLRGVLLGGAAADADLLLRAREAGVRVTTSYGMTETCGGCVYDGEVLRDVAVAVEPVDGLPGPGGRIRLSGATVADGYHLDELGSAAAFDRDAFLTNDLGRLIDGRLVVLGRIDDVIVSGGENVPAAAVESALREAGNVADVAVVGIPDPQWGQRVVAVVVAAGGELPRLPELRDLVAARHPRSWAPKDVVVTDALPRTALGKTDRAAVAAMARAALPLG